MITLLPLFNSCLGLFVYSHSMRLLELANLLDLIHKVSSVYILHDEVQSVLDKDEVVRKERRISDQLSVLLRAVFMHVLVFVTMVWKQECS